MAILLIRGQQVMIDADLASLYGVTTKALNQAVSRNEKRFPSDFMFRLTTVEKAELVTNCDRLQKLKHSSALPRAFTEQGVAMLSSILNSDRAIEVNIEIMRTFLRLRRILSTHKEPAKKLSELETNLQDHDEKISLIFDAIRQLMTPPEKSQKKIGFTVKEKQKPYSKSRPARALDGFSLTPRARRIWNRVPGGLKVKILNNVWCIDCRDVTGIGKVSGKVERGMLVLRGVCTRCGGEVARVIESE